MGPGYCAVLKCFGDW